MKLESCLMIRLIIQNTVNVEQLTLILEGHITKYFPTAKMSLYANTPYWKYPHENVVIYNLRAMRFITVLELINTFSLSWEYKEGMSYNTNLQRAENLEDAVWGKHCHLEEQFLIFEVEWVHVYTWHEYEEPVIN